MAWRMASAIGPRSGPSEQAQHRACREEHHRRSDDAQAEGSTAEMVPFHKVGEGQFQAPKYPGNMPAIAALGPKKGGKCMMLGRAREASLALPHYMG